MPANRLRHGIPFYFSCAKLVVTVPRVPCDSVSTCKYCKYTWRALYLGAFSPRCVYPCLPQSRYDVCSVAQSVLPANRTPPGVFYSKHRLPLPPGLTAKLGSHTYRYYNTATTPTTHNAALTYRDKGQGDLPCVETSLCLSKKKKHIFHLKKNFKAKKQMADIFIYTSWVVMWFDNVTDMSTPPVCPLGANSPIPADSL